jgi:hypothetical protein
MIETYDEFKDILGEPQEYKGLKIFPIKIKDMKYQTLIGQIMMIPKNSIPDKDILKMSYLYFLMTVVASMKERKSEDELENNLKELLSHITRKEVNIEYKITKFKSEDKINYILKIGNVAISEEEFDDIREIVLKQSGFSIEYVNEYNPELERKMSLIPSPIENMTLSDQIFSFCVLTGKNPLEIADYTIYQMQGMMERIVILMDYKLYKPLEASGQITIKGNNEIKHYLSHLGKKGRYDSILVKKDTYVEQDDLFKASDKK